MRTVEPAVRTAVRAVLTEPAPSIVESDGRLHVTFDDRRLTVERRPGPDETPRWSVTLRDGSSVVGKFGLFDTPEAVADQVRALAESETTYTVCCDGDRDSRS